jgi:TIR domain/CHAT domain
MSDNTKKDRILILTANPTSTNKLRLDEEVREITEGLRRSKEREQFIIESRWAVRPDDIRRAIFDFEPRIVHFSGHGEIEGELVFEDAVGNAKAVTPEALAGLFELFTDQVKCVVINACHSHQQADAIAQHIDYVIGMKQVIGDKAAIKYAIGFYDAIGAGRTIEIAHKSGVNAIQLEGIPEEQTPTIKNRTSIINPKINGNTANCLDILENQLVNTSNNNVIEVFFSYSHQDEKMRDDLEKHLSLLKRQGIITGWHDRKISAGKEWSNEIDAHLNTAKVILLLISSAFIASDYCWDIEVKTAMQRHEAKEARVIPIILKPTDWKSAPFAKLQALPRDGKAITKWGNRDEAFTNITQGIREAIKHMSISQ